MSSAPFVGWGRWTTHLIGAVFAAVITPLLVGTVLVPEGGNAHQLFQATTDSVVGAWTDLARGSRERPLRRAASPSRC